MSWRDPATYIFIFEDDMQISCDGLIGIFSYDCRLDSTYKEAGVKSFESYTSETREEYLAYLREWKDETPKEMMTEESINAYPIERKYFDAKEGLELVQKLRNHFMPILESMNADFDYIQKVVSGNSEFILEEEMDWDIEELREPRMWYHTHQYSKDVDLSHWYYTGDDDDIAYSRKEIQHVSLLVEFFGELEKEFEKHAEKKSGWYLKMHVPY